MQSDDNPYEDSDSIYSEDQTTSNSSKSDEEKPSEEESGARFCEANTLFMLNLVEEHELLQT